MSHICSTNSFHYVWSELDSLLATRSASLSSSPCRLALPGSRPWPNSVDSPLAHLQLNVQPATQGLPYRLLGSFSLSLSPLTIYPTNSTSHPQVALFPQLFLGSPLCMVFQKVSLVGHTSLSSLLSGVMAMSEIVASYTFVFWLS